VRLKTKHDKKHFHHLLFHCFDSKKKTVIKAYRFILEIYSESILSVKTCKYWFWRFKSGDFDLKGKERWNRSTKKVRTADIVRWKLSSTQLQN